MKKNQNFLQRNSVAIVMIPSIIGIHYAWNLMQKNRMLVAADEEIELPVVTFAKFCWSQVKGVTGAENVENTNKPAPAATSVK